MALWPFGERTFLEADDEAWQVETWRWFLGLYGGVADLAHSRLVLPTRDFFPPTDKSGHERAEHIFHYVKRWARMPGWPCRLIEQPRRAEMRVSDIAFLKPVTHAPAGTFGFDGEEVVISYEPSNLDAPGVLIATFAHELAHYLMAAHRKDVPGGEGLHEPATDLLTVYLGFGVFGTAACFNYEAGSSSWGWSRHGYLSQRAWIFALAVFLVLTGKSSDPAEKFLKAHLLSDLAKAKRYLERNEIAARITAP